MFFLFLIEIKLHQHILMGILHMRVQQIISTIKCVWFQSENYSVKLLVQEKK